MARTCGRGFSIGYLAAVEIQVAEGALVEEDLPFIWWVADQVMQRNRRPVDDERRLGPSARWPARRPVGLVQSDSAGIPLTLVVRSSKGANSSEVCRRNAVARSTPWVAPSICIQACLPQIYVQYKIASQASGVTASTVALVMFFAGRTEAGPAEGVRNSGAASAIDLRRRRWTCRGRRNWCSSGQGWCCSGAGRRRLGAECNQCSGTNDNTCISQFRHNSPSLIFRL